MLEEFKAWLNEPFKESMSAFEWFLFFGLLIAISIAWAIILRQLKELSS